MPTYLFVSPDGFTLSPKCESCEPDIDNLQVLGWADGLNEDEALQTLLKENPQILELGFEKITIYSLQRVEPVFRSLHR